jgi:cytochrome c oxidase subunit III
MAKTVVGAFPFQPGLPVGSIGLRASGMWGVVLLILSETSIFAYLFFSYFYFSVQPHSGQWPPSGPPAFTYSAPQTAAALAACVTAWWANRSVMRASRLGLLLGLALTLLLSLVFIALQFLDWHSKPFGLATDPYSSFYFVIGGVHLAHVVVGVVMLTAVLAWSLLGYFGPVRHVPITVAALYWYFVAAVWLGVFFTLFISPHLG